MYVIENRHGERWSNEFGWVEEGFDSYTADEKRRFNLPVGGRWSFVHTETQTLRRRKIRLTRKENIDRVRRGLVERTVEMAHFRMHSSAWGTKIDQWEGRAMVGGRLIPVWGWNYRDCIPTEWADVREV